MSTVLDLVIAMAMIFLAASLMVTATQELIAGLFALRARNLRKGLQNLLADNATVIALLKQPLIDSLSGPGRLPSYIPSKTFAQSVVTLVAAGRVGQEAAEAVLTWARENRDQQRLAAAVEALMVGAEQDLQSLQTAVAGWYDDAMERVSGVYKRLTQKISLAIGVIIALLLNLDAVHLFRMLIADEALRAAAAAVGTQLAARGTAPSLPELLDGLRGQGLSAGAFGWTWSDVSWGGLANALPGCIITALATSLGAAFWFDILQRVARIRAAGTSPAERKDEKTGS